MKVKKCILASIIVLACTFTPSAAYAETTSVTSSDNFGWNGALQYPVTYSPAYYLKQCMTSLQYLYTKTNSSWNTFMDYGYGWNYSLQYPSTYSPAYYLKTSMNSLNDLYTKVNSAVSSAQNNVYGWSTVIQSPANYTPAFYLKQSYGTLSDIYSKLSTMSGGGSSGGGGGTVGIEDWATLMGWMSSINGNQQLIYGEVQNIYDKMGEGSDSDYSGQLENIETLLSTIAPQVRDISTANDESTLKKITDLIRSYTAAIKTDTDAIKTNLNTSRDNVYGWNAELQYPTTYSPAYYLKDLGVTLHDLYNRVNGAVTEAEDNNYGWNVDIQYPTTYSPAYYLREAYNRLGDIYDRLGNGSSGSMPEQPWHVIADNLPVYNTNPAIVRVHDEGLFDQLTGIQTSLNRIIGILATPDVSDIVGDFDYDNLLDEAESIQDQLMNLAPFGAFALISAMLAIWSGSNVLTEPRFDVPFQFVAGNQNVVIDVSWMTGVKPVIDFVMVSLLILCLVNASIRVIEMEASH